MSSATILQEIKAALQDDADLAAYASQKWDKAITVKITWRNREEISASDLPLIMITRPSSRRAYQNGRREVRPAIRLYAGFYQPDEEKRQIELIEFEDTINSVLENNLALRRYIDPKDTTETANDEAALGDTCFCVIQAGMLIR
jgi:hypothetical protein